MEGILPPKKFRLFPQSTKTLGIVPLYRTFLFTFWSNPLAENCFRLTKENCYHLLCTLVQRETSIERICISSIAKIKFSSSVFKRRTTPVEGSTTFPSSTPLYDPTDASSDSEFDVCPSPPHDIPTSNPIFEPKPKKDPITKKEICEVGRDGKYLYNSHAREFTKVIQRRCVDPQDFYPSWKKVPDNVKEQWFDEFLTRYSHYGYTREQAFSTFKNYGKEAYKNMVGKMKAEWKETGKMTFWMNELLWEKWLAHWQDPKVNARSIIASKNRRTGAGGIGSSTHAGGSVSFAQKLHKMEAQNGGNEVNLFEALVTYNAKKDENGKVLKDDNGEVVFIHPKKKRIMADYIANVQPDPILQMEGEEQERTIDIANIPFNRDQWIASSGGIHKGRVLGFGPKMALFGEGSTSHPSGCVSGSAASNDLASLQEALIEAQRREEVAQRRAEEALQREQEMHNKMDSMMESHLTMQQAQKAMQEQLLQLLTKRSQSSRRSRPRPS